MSNVFRLSLGKQMLSCGQTDIVTILKNEVWIIIIIRVFCPKGRSFTASGET